MNLPKTYEPASYEHDIYALWEKSGVFEPVNRGSKDSYTILMPPPNANGNLHLGHALTLALQDISIRFERLRGKASLYLPGADHAGLETQVVYERILNKEGKSRFDFSRDDLYKQIYEFVQSNKNNFEGQVRALGASCDWSRFVFTLDDKVVDSAYKVFKKMWDDGLIYRGERIVNYSTALGTAYSDIEVVYKEVKGKLWYINYPLTDGSGTITVATTRPETMLGDTAVAVNPKDDRYTKYVGKTIKLPLTHREIPIITDDFVDKEFGTGAVKVTPAHDPNDFEMAKRHDLPFVHVINTEGNITHEMPESYRGLTVEDARLHVVADLQGGGFLEKEEPYTHSVGHCYKTDTPIQPLLREQWFVDMKPLAKAAIKEIKADKITFYPLSKKNQILTYLKNIKDWNISRQIAWGIPIPAFQNVDQSDDWIFDTQVDKEIINVGTKTYRRDPDVFDTWFSSGQWPFVTLDYPDGEDFKKFYPLDLMETGFDILYPWVARMIMLGTYVVGEVPFKSVYLHGMVTDEHGQKMSKSKGNGINPMEVLEKYGSDALRMGIIYGQSAGNNQPFGYSKSVAGRNFANKLWNIARYTENTIGDDFNGRKDPKPQTAADHWILRKLQQGTADIASALEKYRYSEAYELMYHLVWDDVADWYIEASKKQTNQSVLAFTLETILKLAHPFAPFVTETIWQTLKWEDGMLITAEWPSVPDGNGSKAEDFEEIKNIVSEIRFIYTALQLKRTKLYYLEAPFLEENAELIKQLTSIEGIEAVEAGHGLHLTTTKFRCWLNVDSHTAGRFREKLVTRYAAQQKAVAALQARLNNKEYLKQAPKHLVEQTKSQMAEAETLLNNIGRELESFTEASKEL